MISRRSAQALGDVYEAEFTFTTRLRSGTGYSTHIQHDQFYDFLYSHDYPAWFCNATKKLIGARAVKEWVMKLHTGESQFEATTAWTWEQRAALGQKYLTELAEDVIVHDATVVERYGREGVSAAIQRLTKWLELDGYLYRDGNLLRPQSDVINVMETRGVLDHLYTTLGLGERDTAIHHLELSEEHFLAGRWDDAISNSRKFLELVLSQSAATHATQVSHPPLATSLLESPNGGAELFGVGGRS